MKFEDIENAVEVQRKAYQMLLWLKQRIRTNPKLFAPEQTEPFTTGATCEQWMGRHEDSFPVQLRPNPGQERAFAYVLASFFNTSFRIAEVRHWDTVETNLVAGMRGIRGRRHKQKVIQRQTQRAEDLRLLTLSQLAEEYGQDMQLEIFEKAVEDLDFSQQLTRYAYGVELVRRCHYASQGTAVHRLWLELDESVRKNLSANTIWKAREYLLKWLQEKTLENKI